MRFLYAFICLLFIVFAAVQYNDPDALFWAPVYLVPALWAGVAAWRPAALKGQARGLLWLSVVAALLGVAWFWPTDAQFWRQEVWWNSEGAREGMGMMIALVGLLILALATRRRSADPGPG